MSVTSDHYESATKVIRGVLDDLRPQLLKGFGSISAEYKQADQQYFESPVTELDRLVEAELKKALAVFDSSIGFEGEESGASGNTDTHWLVDPIDGTHHFIRGIPLAMCMVGLVQNKRPTYGLLYNFYTDELYVGYESTATRNGEKIQVSAQKTLAKSMISPEVNQKYHPEFYNKLQAAGALDLNLICAGGELALVADGRVDARISMSGWCSNYDLAAGSAIIEAAGGVAINLDGTVYTTDNVDMIAAGTPELAAALMNL